MLYALTKIFRFVCFFASLTSFCSCSNTEAQKSSLNAKMTLSLSEGSQEIDFAYVGVTYFLDIYFNKLVNFDELSVQSDKNEAVDIYPAHDYQGISPYREQYGFRFVITELCDEVTFVVKCQECITSSTISTKINKVESSLLSMRKDNYEHLNSTFNLISNYDYYTTHYYSTRPKVDETFFDNHDMLIVLVLSDFYYPHYVVVLPFIQNDIFYVQIIADIEQYEPIYPDNVVKSSATFWLQIPKNIEFNFSLTGFYRFLGVE